jgi:hypothetical protein
MCSSAPAWSMAPSCTCKPAAELSGSTGVGEAPTRGRD